MLQLRRQGWNLSQLSRYYEVHHTSIRHWIIKFDLNDVPLKRTGEISQLPPEKRLSTTPREDDWYTDERGDKVFRGKPYAQICAEATERKRNKPPIPVVYVNWKSQNGFF